MSSLATIDRDPNPPSKTLLRVHPNTRTPASHLYKPGPPCSSKHKDPSPSSQQASASVFIQTQGPQSTISTNLGLCVHPNTRTPAHHLNKPGPLCSSKHKDPSPPSQQTWASVFIQTQGPQSTISTNLGLCVHPNTRTPAHHLNKPGTVCSSKHKDPSSPSQQTWASVFIQTQGPQLTISTNLGLCVHPNTRTPAHHLNKPSPLFPFLSSSVFHWRVLHECPLYISTQHLFYTHNKILSIRIRPNQLRLFLGSIC